MPLLGIPSFWELVIIFAVVFLLFGGKKLITKNLVRLSL